MISIKRALVAVILIASAACSKMHPAEPSIPSKSDGGQAKTSEEFSLDKIEVKCAADKCPDAVGVLIYLETRGDQLFLHRCTAFMIAPDTVMSGGHCHKDGYGEGYFITRTDLTKKAVRKIAAVPISVYDPQGGPDAGFFKLDQPIDGIAPLHMARGDQKIYQRLTGYFSAQIDSASQLKLQIEKVECTIHRHEREFPFDLKESPSLIRAFDCASVHGNSGGPLMAGDDNLEVEAIEQAQPASTAPMTRPWILLTNLRCLNDGLRPEPSCQKVTDEEIARRFEEADRLARDQIFNHSTPDFLDKSFGYETRTYRLKSDLEDYEVMQFPTCRRDDLTDKGEVHFPAEEIQLSYNEWGNPQVKVINERTVVAQFAPAIGSTENHVYDVTFGWPPAFAEYITATNDPRVSLGAKSPIALPPCRR